LVHQDDGQIGLKLWLGPAEELAKGPLDQEVAAAWVATLRSACGGIETNAHPIARLDVCDRSGNQEVSRP
jgi:hypothetical protein